VKKLVRSLVVLGCSSLFLASPALAADNTSSASTRPATPTAALPEAGQNSASKPPNGITRQVDLYIPASASLRLSGMFLVRVQTPKGEPVTSRHLVVALYGVWNDSRGAQTHHVLGSAEAVAGKAVIKYQLPADLVGRTILLQATAIGGGFRAVPSSLCRARVH